MKFQKPLSIFLLFFTFLITGVAQELSIKDVKDLKTSHDINFIYRLTTHNSNGLLLADTRFDSGDLDGLLIYFDENGKILKEIRVGRTNSFESIVDLVKYENGYYLLLNSVSQQYQTSLLLYHLDKDLLITSTEDISISGMDEASAVTFDPTRNELKIIVSITDDNENIFPRLVSYDIENKTQSFLDFNKKTRPEKEDESAQTIMVIKDGKQTVQKLTRAQMKAMGMKSFTDNVNKSCASIRFANENYDELLITGTENSSTITDFWVAKVVDNEIVWEDRYPTDVGGDNGKSTFKTKDGYITFGHEYTKKIDRYYSYRALILDHNGKETDAKEFDTGKKDWFKDVEQLGEQYFLMIGQSQLITLPKTRMEMQKVETSNMWIILVNDKGEKVTDYVFETESLDEAFVLSKLDNGDSLLVFRSDGVLKVSKIIINIP